MKKPVFAFLLVACVAVLFSCEKEQAAKSLPPFDLISANGPMTFNLITGIRNSVISTTLLENQYNVSNGVLSINGSGTMTLAVNDINSFWCNACTIENDGTLIADTLNMTVHGGHVDLNDLKISGWLGLDAQNTGIHEFTGTANFFKVTTSNLASIDAYGLIADSVYVDNNGISGVEVTGTQVVNVFIRSLGSVYYKGHPPIVRLTRTGSGSLVNKD